MKQAFVYILTNKRNGTLYIGVTTDISKRLMEHKNGVVEGFSKKYELNKLAYYETHDSIDRAILREQRLKKWERSWKLRLIEEQNPTWVDLSEEACKI